MLFTHVGRWNKGQKPQKYGVNDGHVSVRWQQYLMVREKGKWALYDLKKDPGEKNDLAAKHPEVVGKLDKAYDQWWAKVQPNLVNEQAYLTAPTINPFHELYWKQFQGPGPNNVPPKKKTAG
jgi:arylsulfatase